MAQIHNSNLTKELVDVVKIQTSFDSIPNQIAEKVVPVIDVNPKHARVIDIVRTGDATNATTSTTLYTTPTDKDFYLVGAAISMVKDATAQALVSRISATPFGASGSVAILAISGLTLTAQNQSLSISLPVPIRLARGTTITVNNSNGTANIRTDAVIHGYLVDNINA